MSLRQRQTGVAGSMARVQNVTGAQTVKATPGYVYTIALSNAAGSAGTLTLTDGSTTLTVVQVAANATVMLHLNVEFATSIKCTPSAATIDALFIYD